MKKIFSLILLLGIALLSGCVNTSKQPNQNLSISINNNSLEVGSIIKLATNIAKVVDNNMFTEDDVNWTSSNLEVATVNKGIIEAVSPGVVEITAQVDQYIAKKSFTVTKKAVVPSLKIFGLQNVKIGETITLSSQLINVEGEVVWESQNSKIATVNNKGVVSGISSGIVIITAYMSNDSSVKDEHLVDVSNLNGQQDILINEIVRTIVEMEGTFDLTSVNNKVVSLVEASKDAVVGVSNYQKKISNGKEILERSGVGTGVIYKKVANGEHFTYTLITNYHVIDKNSNVKVYLGYLDYEVDATVLKTSEEYDLAILEFTDSVDIEPLAFGNLDSYYTGDFVVAIGNANGYEYFGSVTFGIISDKDRNLEDEASIFIQHDAAINPGNSGGPLFDLNGKIIGINTLKLASFNIDNMGFAVSIETILPFIN
jgi:hypothetical protein